jgi:membrane protein required for beta-lactamase induction
MPAPSAASEQIIWPGGEEVEMTQGLVLLAAWAEFGLLLAVLVWFLLRGTRR